MLIGLDSELHSKAEQLDHSKSEQIAAVLDSYVLVPFRMLSTKAIAVAMVPIILILNHPKFEHQNIQGLALISGKKREAT